MSNFHFIFIFIEQPDFIPLVLRQIDIDCQFLEAENIMDYSLLIGVHFCNYSTNGEMNLSPSGTNSGNLCTSTLQLLYLFICFMIYFLCNLIASLLRILTDIFSGKADAQDYCLCDAESPDKGQMMEEWYVLLGSLTLK